MKNVTRNLSAVVLTGALSASLTGCAGFSKGLFKDADDIASRVYVVQDTSTSSMLLEFTAQSLLSHTPTATITAPDGLHFESVAADASGQVYAGVFFPTGGGEILVYAPGATGAATPARIIKGDLHSNGDSFYDPTSLTVGPNGMLYVLSPNVGSNTDYSISVFAAGATGAATPVKVLKGANTQVESLLGVAVDKLGNIYASSQSDAGMGKILVFGATQSGNVVPSRVIQSHQMFYGVAVDSKQNVYAVQDSPSFATAGSIVEFDKSDAGYAAPKSSIAGGQTGIFVGAGLRMDGAGNLYLLNVSAAGSATGTSLEVFAAGSTGNVPPVIAMSSAAWTAPNGELSIQ